jgi:hypothetical protein
LWFDMVEKKLSVRGKLLESFKDES